MAKDISHPELLDEALKLKRDRWVNNRKKYGFRFNIVQGEKSTGYLPYKDARKQLLDELIEKDYQEYIDNLLNRRM